MKPWPSAPAWMEAWDGEEPLVAFIFREGPREDAPKDLWAWPDEPPPVGPFIKIAQVDE